MRHLIGNAVVGQSGGPTVAINATLSGVIKGAFEAKEKGIIPTIYGMRNGMEGFLREDLILLNEAIHESREFALLETTPASALGSCRKKLPPVESGDAIYPRILEIFRKYSIRYFFYIGGNDSMDTVAKLSAYMRDADYEMRIIGVPKTIDNDLVMTDHTPGFGSAAKYIATTMQEIVRDCAVYTVPAVTIVEVMGRDAGWLTTAAALPKKLGHDGPDLLYLPEVVFDLEDFLTSVRQKLAQHPNVVIAVSEGIRYADGTYVGASLQGGGVDSFGHQYLAGTAKVLEQIIRERIGCKVRGVELSLPQRCAAHLASMTDILESVNVGKYAVKSACAGQNGVMIAMERRQGRDGFYRAGMTTHPVSEVANKIKTVPAEYILPHGEGVTEECLDYLLPLIRGEAPVKYKDGLPLHFTFA